MVFLGMSTPLNNQRNYHAIRVFMFLFPDILPVLSAQDGAAIYKERCASCHDALAERVPSLQTIKAMSPEAVYMTLTSGELPSEKQSRGYADSPDLRALIAYIAPTGTTHADAPSIAPTCKSNAAFVVDAKITPMEWLERQPQQLTFSRRRIGRPHVLHRSKTEIEMGVQPG